jgi:hypothetical protein
MTFAAALDDTAGRLDEAWTTAAPALDDAEGGITRDPLGADVPAHLRQGQRRPP